MLSLDPVKKLSRQMTCTCQHDSMRQAAAAGRQVKGSITFEACQQLQVFIAGGNKNGVSDVDGRCDVVCCAGQLLCLARPYMVSPVDKELAKVTAHKACPTGDKHTVALHTWLGFDHCSPGEARCLCRTLHTHAACGYQ